MPLEFCCYLLSTLLLFFWLSKPQKVVFKKLGLTFLGLGFLLFLFEFLGKFLNLYKRPISLFEIFANISVGVFYFLLFKFKEWNIVKFAPVVSSLALLLTLLGLKLGKLQNWKAVVFVHVFAALFAFALLLFSALFSAMRYWGEFKLKRKELNLPLGIPLNLWVRLENTFFFFGFIFLTLDLILNFILLKAEVGRFEWDSRIVSTLLIWLYYWFLFHADRWGVEFFKKHFAFFNILGATLLVLSLLFTRHGF